MLVDTEAPLIAVRRPSIVHQAIDASERRLRSFNESLPVALLRNVCFVKYHAVWHS